MLPAKDRWLTKYIYTTVFMFAVLVQKYLIVASSNLTTIEKIVTKHLNFTEL